MQICGLNKTTLLDYPEHVAATIFIGGCNFKCPFCHNGDLVLRPQELASYSKDDIASFLKKRLNILSGICITGGEPTLAKQLPDLIEMIKSYGYKVKLDTNGSNPVVLEQLFKNNLLDYIAMDIKADPQNYASAIGMSLTSENYTFDLESIQSSIDIIRKKAPQYEFRTTVVKELHNEETFLNIGTWLHGSSNYFLQNFEENPSIITKGLHSYDKKSLLRFSETLFPHFNHVGIRGIS